MPIKNIISKKNLILVLFIFVLIAIDQIAKKLIIYFIPLGNSISLLDKIIYLRPLKNQGLIMGFLPYSIYFTIFISVLTVILLIFLWLFELRKKTKLGMILIISGAGGNLWDRITKGAVLDFIDLKLWPVFNLADVFITIGVILLCINLIWFQKKSLKKE